MLCFSVVYGSGFVFITTQGRSAWAWAAHTVRSVEDENRNGHRNAKRNPNQNHETSVLALFSFENLKTDVDR